MFSLLYFEHGYLGKYLSKQCSKLRFYFVHVPGAKRPKMMHKAICSCVTRYMNSFPSQEKHAHIDSLI